MELKNHWNNLWKKHNQSSMYEFIDDLQARKCFEMYLKLLKGRRLPKKLDIIEIGSGTGKLTMQLAKKFKNSKCTLVDYSKEALNLSKRKFEENGIRNQTFIHSDVFKFKTKNKYDIVHSGGLIEHFEGKKLDEIVRKHLELCKKNGFIIILVPAPLLWYKIYRKTMEIVGIWPKNIENPMNEYFLTELAEKNDIKVLNSITFSGLARSAAIIGTPR